MKISICSIGKTNSKEPENLLINEYVKRLKWKVSLKELVAINSIKNIETQKLRESESIIELAQNSYIISLDLQGKMFSSEEFAKFMNDLQMQSSDVCFCIGGSHGHHKSLLDKSRNIISLGKLTMPHKLARLILLEQIYRAESILNNHPYHK
jgi:23S rRNA (pseudouridine1915-N3)-methyltransferase